MREVLFRGKRIDNGEWVYWNRLGRLTDINGELTRVEINISAFRPYAFYVNELPLIEGETVGQYTGLTDKNGKNIFEGDIVTYVGEVCLVKWDDETAKFVLESENLVCDFEEVWYNRNRVKSKIEIIDNVHDNPELLEESDE